MCPLVTGQLRALAQGLPTGVTREGPLPQAWATVLSRPGALPEGSAALLTPKTLLHRVGLGGGLVLKPRLLALWLSMVGLPWCPGKLHGHPTASPQCTTRSAPSSSCTFPAGHGHQDLAALPAQELALGSTRPCPGLPIFTAPVLRTFPASAGASSSHHSFSVPKTESLRAR